MRYNMANRSGRISAGTNNKEDIMKRTLAILLTVLLCFGLLAGCGQNDPSAPAAGSASAGGAANAGDDAKGEPAKVVFAMKTFNVVPPTETIQTVADEVNRYIRETYPEVNIELEWVLYGPGDYDQKINLMMQSGDQLDLFIPSNIATSLSANQLAPITESLNTYGKELREIIELYCGDDVSRTDFADIQNKKECGGNKQWQRRFLRNWVENTNDREII